MTLEEKYLIENGYNPRLIITAFRDENIFKKYIEVHPENSDYIYEEPNEEKIQKFINNIYRIIKRLNWY